MSRRMLMIVSAQPMANLLAACEPSFEIGEVHLIVSGEMQADGIGDRLADVLEARGLSCFWHSVSEPYQPESTRECAARLLGEAPEGWTVNLTGGTKPMAIGAYRAALDCGVRDIIYLDHDQGLLRWMESNRPPLAASARFGVAEVAMAHGYQARPGKWPSPACIAFAQRLFAELDTDARRCWHQIMSDVEQACRSRRKWTPEWIALTPPQPVADLLHEACRLQLCAFTGERLRIEDPDDHHFLAGAWFELVVAEALRKAAGDAGRDLHDLKIGLNVTSPDRATNEIDVAAVIGRRLLVIECKAGDYWSDGKPANTAYKLEHHKRLGGLGTRLILAATASLQEPVHGRMRDAGILVADALTPQNIHERLGAYLAD